MTKPKRLRPYTNKSSQALENWKNKMMLKLYTETLKHIAAELLLLWIIGVLEIE